MKKFLKQFNVNLSLFLFSLCICLCNFKPYVYAAENKKCSNFTNHTIKPNQSAFFTTIQKKISDNSLGMDNKDEEKGLVISTVHSAKGLEWEYVFVLDCVTGVYPGFNAMSMAEEERQENLRVFYVAITRAKKQMYLCVPEIYHEQSIN